MRAPKQKSLEETRNDLNLSDLNAVEALTQPDIDFILSRFEKRAFPNTPGIAYYHMRIGATSDPMVIKHVRSLVAIGLVDFDMNFGYSIYSPALEHRLALNMKLQ